MRLLRVSLAVALLAGCAGSGAGSDLTIEILNESDGAVLATFTAEDMSDWRIIERVNWYCFTLSESSDSAALRDLVAGTYAPPLATRVTIDGRIATGGVLSMMSPMVWGWPTLRFDHEGDDGYCLESHGDWDTPDAVENLWQRHG